MAPNRRAAQRSRKHHPDAAARPTPRNSIPRETSGNSHARPFAELERVFLPLADGASVDMLLCMTVFYASDGREM
jgi:hypothetical protein